MAEQLLGFSLSPFYASLASMPIAHIMLQGGYDNRRGPPPGMRPMPGGPLPQLHKTQSAYKVRGRGCRVGTCV